MGWCYSDMDILSLQVHVHPSLNPPKEHSDLLWDMHQESVLGLLDFSLRGVQGVVLGAQDDGGV